MNPGLIFNLGDRYWPYQDNNYYNLQENKTYLGVYNKFDKSVKVTDKLQIIDSINGFFDGKLHSATPDGQLVGLIDAVSFIENMDGFRK